MRDWGVFGARSCSARSTSRAEGCGRHPRRGFVHGFVHPRRVEHGEPGSPRRGHQGVVVVDDDRDPAFAGQAAQQLELDQPRGPPVARASHDQPPRGQPVPRQPPLGIAPAALGTAGEPDES